MKLKNIFCSFRGHKLDGPNYISPGVVGPVHCGRCCIEILPHERDYPAITVPHPIGYVIIKNSEMHKYFKDIDS